jgi:hypothetical protein
MQEEVQAVTLTVSDKMASCGAASGAAAPPEAEPQAAWKRWVLPSFADVFFIVLAGILGFSQANAALLFDSDTGWHIRNGEFILATHSVPHVDSFSYTRAGWAWCSFEWLYDTTIAAIHHFAGLNGVVLFTAVVIAFTFALLFRLLLRRSGSFVTAMGLTLLAVAAAQVHMLARPHVVTWLFVLLWVELLHRFEEGSSAALLWLPPMMLVWVNAHGGFVLGLVLLALFGCASIWNYLMAPGTENRRKILQLGAVFCTCGAVTLLNPYGYKLHLYVYRYLSDSFFMDSIGEFQSPNFHSGSYRYFELFILLAVLGFALARERVTERVTTTDLLLLLFSIHAGLFACRNIPIAAILMSLSMAPLWAGIISPKGNPLPCPRLLASALKAVNGISEDMAVMEGNFRGHALAIVVLAAGMAIVLNGGRVFSTQIVSAHFSEKAFPAKAAEFIAQKGIHDHLFNTDLWSGYLIYKLYPGTKLFVDDRHDFYGEEFIKEYLDVKYAAPRWRQILDKYQVKWVLIDTGSPLATVLKESRDWRAEYNDGMAIVFARVSP